VFGILASGSFGTRSACPTHHRIVRMHPTRNTYRRTPGTIYLARRPREVKRGGGESREERGKGEGRGSLRRRCFLIVYPICPRKQGQSAGKTRPLTRTIPGPRDRACQRCIIGFLYAHVKCSSRTLAHNVTGREVGGELSDPFDSRGFRFEFRARPKTVPVAARARTRARPIAIGSPD